jgi:hypothetical protein
VIDFLHFFMHVKSHEESCDVWILRIFCLVSFWLVYNYVFVTFETFSFNKNNFLYEYNFLWNRIMKEIVILILKGFGIVYVKFMVGEWCDILVIHKQ